VSLRHESEISQAGGVRKVSFEIRGRAIGAITESVLAADLGTDHVFAGFLGAQRNGRGIVFHIQSIESK
jgi:primosomal replication protein N